MTTETKSLDPVALAGLTTGVLLSDFSAMHEAAEHVMGHPVWTHQFSTLRDKIQAAVLAQFPDMPTSVEPIGWKATRDAVRARYGETVEVRKGTEEGIHPLDPAGFPDAMKT